MRWVVVCGMMVVCSSVLWAAGGDGINRTKSVGSVSCGGYTWSVVVYQADSVDDPFAMMMCTGTPFGGNAGSVYLSDYERVFNPNTWWAVPCEPGAPDEIELPCAWTREAGGGWLTCTPAAWLVPALSYDPEDGWVYGPVTHLEGPTWSFTEGGGGTPTPPESLSALIGLWALDTGGGLLSVGGALALVVALSVGLWVALRVVRRGSRA